MIRTLLSVLALLGLAFSLQLSDIDFVNEYDSFHFDQSSHVRKRSDDGSFEFNIKLGGQEYTLNLQHNYELIQGIADSITGSRSFLKGTVQGHPNSIVRLSMEESFLEGIVIIDDESHYVENVEAAEGFNTIAYKASSVKREADESSLKARCKSLDAVTVPQGSVAAHSVHMDSDVTKRADAKDCKIALIADIKYSQKYGANTQSNMISLVNAIEALYLKQLNVGLPIIFTHVVTSTSDSSGLGTPSNTIEGELNQLAAAVKGKTIPGLPTACLVHAFTYQDFGGTLGLAYTSSPATNTIGGICSGSGYNTGVSTASNQGREQSLLVRTVTTAHEIGHNFGSKHDTEHGSPPGNLAECNPTDKYMMFPSVNTGKNAQTFSYCSLYEINACIPVKGTCFVTRPTTGPTSAPTTAPPTSSPPTSAPPTSSPPTSAPPTSSPTSAPNPNDQCASDPRLGGTYSACPFQPSGFSPCVLFCADPSDTSSCFYFTMSDGSYLNKNAGSSCGNGMTCSSTGTCVSSSNPTPPPTPPPTIPPTPPPTRAPTLPPTTAPTSTASPSLSPTTAPQPKCPSWAPTSCSTNDCKLSCSYSGYCFVYATRPDGTPCGGNGKCVSGTCRAASAVETKECDPSDACCDENGNLRPLGHVCRPAATLCDIEEVCDPDAPRPSLCPEDLVRPGGSPCNCSDSSDPNTCTASCGNGDFLGICGKANIQSCTGKTCPTGTSCSILKGEAICVPTETRSCQNNCGQSAANTVGCYCDESCVQSGDCCDDYEQFCVVSKGKSINKGTPSWVWGVVGAVVALVAVALVAIIGFVFYKKSQKHSV